MSEIFLYKKYGVNFFDKESKCNKMFRRLGGVGCG